ncbi:hypothetical protein CIHG_03974 [Coccidioides immitis H538.4]|uniref:Uncharacterized protein n=3 Tax=Coccidioides immitis TaxID=5501 RepID=A0A0J8QQU8_COCIT|nr:hypothetical protein CIRG_03725 [Coccidioides immitis RMSCC 2394]KMU75009.1 hypothetical protein CISG_00938 [Coccidioides immitis RMSCC 3703]KMU86186.1 hypothetical protein CIHG_03974 [Coccidioides immitis H538.4]
MGSRFAPAKHMDGGGVGLSQQNVTSPPQHLLDDLARLGLVPLKLRIFQRTGGTRHIAGVEFLDRIPVNRRSPVGRKWLTFLAAITCQPGPDVNCHCCVHAMANYSGALRR